MAFCVIVLLLRRYSEEGKGCPFAGLRLLSRCLCTLMCFFLHFIKMLAFLFFLRIFWMFLQETRMKDRFTLYAKGGDGGSGCYSVRCSRHVRYGRPDGGLHIKALSYTHTHTHIYSCYLRQYYHYLI